MTHIVVGATRLVLCCRVVALGEDEARGWFMVGALAEDCAAMLARLKVGQRQKRILTQFEHGEVVKELMELAIDILQVLPFLRAVGLLFYDV